MKMTGRLNVEIEVENNMCKCASCPFRIVLPDPDPDDWFNDDDEKIVCRVTGKEIAGALRPYETDGITVPVKRCPLLNEMNKE